MKEKEYTPKDFNILRKYFLNPADVSYEFNSETISKLDENSYFVKVPFNSANPKIRYAGLSFNDLEKKIKIIGEGRFEINGVISGLEELQKNSLSIVIYYAIKRKNEIDALPWNARRIKRDTEEFEAMCEIHDDYNNK